MENEDEMLAGGGAGDGEAAAAAGAGDLPGRGAAAEPGYRDRAEEGFEQGAADRADRGSRRDDSKIRRLLRDRAILATELATARAELAAERARVAKARAEGFGAELTRAEREVAAAVEAGDAEAIARANRRVAELAAGRTAATYEAQSAEREAEAAKRAPLPEPEPAVSDATQSWLDANRWFGQDARMTRQARLLDQEAREEGIAVDSPAYWRYIEEGIEQRFPGRVTRLHSAASGAARGAQRVEVDEGERAPADPAVAARVPASAASGAAPVARGPTQRPAPGTAPIRLSAEALEVARMLGLSPQQYAARAVALAKDNRVNLKTISGA